MNRTYRLYTASKIIGTALSIGLATYLLLLGLHGAAIVLGCIVALLFFAENAVVKFKQLESEGCIDNAEQQNCQAVSRTE